MPGGRVKWYDPNRGYGVIEPDRGDKDVIFRSARWDTDDPIPEEGCRVEYALTDARRGNEAQWVRPDGG